MSLFHVGKGNEMGTRPYIREITLCPAAGISDTQARLCKLPSLSLCLYVRTAVRQLLVYRM